MGQLPSQFLIELYLDNFDLLAIDINPQFYGLAKQLHYKLALQFSYSMQRLFHADLLFLQ